MRHATLAAALVLSLALPAGSQAKTLRIGIDRSGTVPVPCANDPHCHNRWSPAIPPAAWANPGDTVIFETRDAFDNPFNR
ncbi:MAG TPA: acetamidase/formamidase family protein, partial [Anaeromyxobacteraceae bacterium]|nr:acetamidase/formamidase family protein [Anaeromyxobacteraceae bacterium]